jgi:predicted metalloprotease with PDZ domain
MDFKIRHVTAGRKSLDDVMRTLYQRYYKDKNRGYTDREFRKTVEEVAGTSLDDIFRYTSTTKSINYAKYLAYAGLAIDTTYKTTDNGYLGAKVIEKSGRLAVTGIVRDSPAWKGGLGSGDVILKINGEHATTTKWDNMCSSAKAGDKVTLLTILNGFKKEIELTFGAAKHKSFNITRVAHPTKEQQRVFSAWLK